MPKVSIVVLTLNEIDGMRAIMPRIKKEWYDQLEIIDGGSIDGTIAYALSNKYTVTRQAQRGMGGAFRNMRFVTGEIIILFSPDGNCIPEVIPELVKKIEEGYDIVIASRYAKGAKSYDDDWLTGFGNWMFTRLFNFLFSSHYTDILGMYRAYRRDLLEQLGVTGDSNYWGTQILARATRRKARIAEIPADEPKRIGGKRKMRPFVNGAGELWTIWKEFWR